jgi:hypothetical protein
MARAVVVLCVLAVWGCSDNPYVIGRLADSGPADAGASDGGIGECGDARAAALLCSGFEGDDVAADFGQTVLVNQGALERSTERVHTGAGALHASSGAMMSVAVVLASFPPLFSGELYVRAYLYVPADLPTETMNIFFVGDEPVPDPFLGLDFNLEDGALQLFSPQSSPDRHTGDVPIPRERWFCFRARIAIADADGSVELFVDDALALQATGLDTLPDDGVGLFRAGVDWSSGQDAFFEIYIDDVVVDTTEIECL